MTTRGKPDDSEGFFVDSNEEGVVRLIHWKNCIQKSHNGDSHAGQKFQIQELNPEIVVRLLNGLSQEVLEVNWLQRRRSIYGHED